MVITEELGQLFQYFYFFFYIFENNKKNCSELIKILRLYGLASLFDFSSFHSRCEYKLTTNNWNDTSFSSYGGSSLFGSSVAGLILNYTKIGYE